MALTIEETTPHNLSGLPELPEAAGSAMCPWCAGPVVEALRLDRGLFGRRYLSIKLFCDDCDLAIRLEWPSTPHRRRPHV
jgi:hypothetical protein